MTDTPYPSHVLTRCASDVLAQRNHLFSHQLPHNKDMSQFGSLSLRLLPKRANTHVPGQVFVNGDQTGVCPSRLKSASGESWRGPCMMCLYGSVLQFANVHSHRDPKRLAGAGRLSYILP